MTIHQNPFRLLFAVFIITVIAIALPQEARGQRADRPGSLSLALPSSDALEAQRVHNSLRLATKLLCSGVFVSNREPQDVIDQDLHWSEYNFFNWKQADWSIDRKSGVVAIDLPAPGYKSHKITARALHEEGYGCTLLPAQAERLPVERPRRKIARTSKPLPRRQHRNSASLNETLRDALNEQQGRAAQRTRALIVIEDGDIIAEQYADGFNKDTRFLGWSMGKSIAAILLGAYAEQHGLDVDQPAPIPEWQRARDPRRSITTRHLLNMAGGLKFHNPGSDDSFYYTDLHDHESLYYRSQNIDQLVINQPLIHQPGTVFAYRNTNTINLMGILRRQLGDEEFYRFPDQALFNPTGAHSFVLETDLYGTPIISGFVFATAQDWARMGLLVLNDGVAAGKRILPKGWRDDVMFKPSPAFAGYGGQMWLNTQRRFRHAPRSAGYFLGWGNQVVMIMPEENVVIVRLGHSDGDFTGYFDEILKDILAALSKEK